MKPLRIGVVGCGNISGIYLENLRSFGWTEVAGVADLDSTRAHAKAHELGVGAASVEELFEDEAVDLILNLTVPKAHHEVAKRALEAGKHVYNEKPLALSRQEGLELLELAASRGLRLGAAPDTFLGAGLQTCRRLIDDHLLGEIVSGQCFMMCHGHESWHPDPEFYYQQGGGPMFDMGPYYVTALVSLLGPVSRVAGMARRTFGTRTISSRPKQGQSIAVEIPTHVVGLLEFRSDAIVELTTSFDVWHHTLPPITLHGEKGSLLAGDPNMFGDPVSIRLAGEADWRNVPLEFAYAKNSRGLGVLDVAFALNENRAHRASGELAYHVLDVMQAIYDAAETRRTVEIASTVERPAPIPKQGL